MAMSNEYIEELGFTKMPDGAQIEAIFNSAIVYSIEGIRFNEVTSETFSDVSYQSSEFSFAFGNSVNEVSRRLLGDDLFEDEVDWKREKKVNPLISLFTSKSRNHIFASQAIGKEMKKS